jgi:hypothetical protein
MSKSTSSPVIAGPRPRVRHARRLDPATRRYTALYGKLLSLTRLSPPLQPAVRPQARQQIPQARPRQDHPDDGRVPARARHRRRQRAGGRRGVGEIQIELLQAGAARAQNLELSPAYEHEAHKLAGQAGVQGRLHWRIHDLAQDPGAVDPADLVILHRVVCCYPDYERLLGAAADHARRALVFSHPPRNALSRAFYVVFNLVMRLTRSSFRGFAHPRARC